MIALPVFIDLRANAPAISARQEELNSCTAHSICAAAHYAVQKTGERPLLHSSALFLYYNARHAEKARLFQETACGFGMKGEPVKILDGLRSISQLGLCPEYAWPYEPERYNQRPTDEAYQLAYHHRDWKYTALPPRLDALKQCLAEGYPFMFGALIYQSFQSTAVSQSGDIPYPSSHDRQIGAHAMLAVGYDDGHQHFIVRNSFGEEWGDNGYGYFPYTYMVNVLHLSFDYYVLKRGIQNNP